jgi:hypothetical protein
MTEHLPDCRSLTGHQCNCAAYRHSVVKPDYYCPNCGGQCLPTRRSMFMGEWWECIGCGHLYSKNFWEGIKVGEDAANANLRKLVEQLRWERDELVEYASDGHWDDEKRKRVKPPKKNPWWSLHPENVLAELANRWRVGHPGVEERLPDGTPRPCPHCGGHGCDVCGDTGEYHPDAEEGV